MNIELSDLLQDIITDKMGISSASLMLDEEMKGMLVRWYLKYSDNKDADIRTILDLLSFLYYKYDIDMTGPSIYLETINYLSEKYCIKRDTFFNMLSDFRAMIFYTNAK